MNKNVTPAVEGGLLTAIAVILGLAATYLPIAGAVVEFFCPIPFVILTVKRGLKIGIAALLVSFILMTLFAGPILSLRIVLTLNVCGVVLGFCVSKKFSTVKSFVATFLSAAISQMILIIFLSVAMDINFADSELSALKEGFADAFNFYETAGIDQQALTEMRGQITKVVELMSYLIPTILILIALINTVACYITSRWIFKKLQMEFIAPLPNFSEWRFPVFFLYLTAFAVIGMYWGETRDWNFIFTAAMNILIFSTGIGLIQGFSILSFFADRYNVSKFWRRFFYLLILLNGLLTQILSFAGLFDMLFDYRKKFSDEK